jgi:hypothetical protein
VTMGSICWVVMRVMLSQASESARKMAEENGRGSKSLTWWMTISSALSQVIPETWLRSAGTL